MCITKHLLESINENDLGSKYNKNFGFDSMLNINDEIFNDSVAINWMKSFDSELSKISDDERKSLDLYRDLYYTKINKYLRSGGSGDSELDKIILNIKSVFSKIKLKHDIIVYRGIKGSAANIYLKSKVGKVIKDSAFLSTSLKRGISKKFSENKVNSVNLRIILPKGIDIIPMQYIGSDSTQTMYSDEFEILLNSNTKLKVVDIGDNLITLEYKK